MYHSMTLMRHFTITLPEILVNGGRRSNVESVNRRERSNMLKISSQVEISAMAEGKSMTYSEYSTERQQNGQPVPVSFSIQYNNDVVKTCFEDEHCILGSQTKHLLHAVYCAGMQMFGVNLNV